MSSITETLLSKSEKKVYDYIKERTQEGKATLKESMKTIGLNVGFSEATVHRAVKKLVSHGVIGITSDTDKSESNAIQFFGEPAPIDELTEEPFFDVIKGLNDRAERFKNIIESYQRQYHAISLENDQLKEQLRSEGKIAESIIEYEGYRIRSEDIIGLTDINEELVAFIIKKK